MVKKNNSFIFSLSIIFCTISLIFGIFSLLIIPPLFGFFAILFGFGGLITGKLSNNKILKRRSIIVFILSILLPILGYLVAGFIGWFLFK